MENASVVSPTGRNVQASFLLVFFVFMALPFVSVCIEQVREMLTVDGSVYAPVDQVVCSIFIYIICIYCTIYWF